MEFTRASRLRLLKTTARIDWTKAKPCIFITLTYPDAALPKSARGQSIHLHSFVRAMEKELGKKVSVIWRIEWEERKTGQHKGKVAPHFHLIVFQTAYMDHGRVNDLWRATIGYKAYCRTEVKGMENERQTGYYVAKYCAKVSGDCSLVNAAYLSNRGRHWGVLRKGLLPVHDLHELRSGTTAQICDAYMAACDKIGINPAWEVSLSLIGDKAADVAAMLFASKDIDEGTNWF